MDAVYHCYSIQTHCFFIFIILLFRLRLHNRFRNDDTDNGYKYVDTKKNCSFRVWKDDIGWLQDEIDHSSIEPFKTVEIILLGESFPQEYSWYKDQGNSSLLEN